MLYILQDSEQWIQKVLLAHLMQSEAEYHETKREAIKEFKAGATDMIRHAAQRRATMVAPDLRRVLEEQRKLEKMVATE